MSNFNKLIQNYSSIIFNDFDTIRVIKIYKIHYFIRMIVVGECKVKQTRLTDGSTYIYIYII